MKIISIRILLLLVMLVLWECIAKAFDNPKLLPSFFFIVTDSLPSISNFSKEGKTGYFAAFSVIARSSITSIVRIFLGLLLGFTMGAIFGCSIHYFNAIKKGNLLLLKILGSAPLLTIIPIFYYWFGGKEIGVILYIAFAVFIIFSTGVYHAILNVSKSHLELAKILGVSNYHLYKNIIFQSILPEISSTIINIVGLSWAISLAAEYLSSSKGLGYLIFQSYVYNNMGHLIIFSAIYCIFGLICYKLCKRLLHSLIVWA